MGQILHGSATTTHAIRAAIQRSKAPLKELAARYGLNRKTVAKWRKRSFLHDAAMGPKAPRSTVLTAAEEAMAVAFRKHTLLPLDDCLYALQATIPHLTRSSLHRCLQRHGISLSDLIHPPSACCYIDGVLIWNFQIIAAATTRDCTVSFHTDAHLESTAQTTDKGHLR